MFHNFIYFIVVLLIYTTYQPSKETHFAPIETLFFFFALVLFFAGLTWVQFKKLEQRITQESLFRLDHKFNAILPRQSIMAILVFAINIYGLNLTSFFSDLSRGVRQ